MTKEKSKFIGFTLYATYKDIDYLITKECDENVGKLSITFPNGDDVNTTLEKKERTIDETIEFVECFIEFSIFVDKISKKKTTIAKDAN